MGKTINLIIVCFLLHLFGHYKVWKGISCYFHQKINTIKLNLPPRGKIALTRRTVLAELVQVGKTSNLKSVLWLFYFHTFFFFSRTHLQYDYKGLKVI